MLQETGTVVKVDGDSLWVETRQQSACNSCRARAGCGQQALGKALAGSSVIRVLLNGRSSHLFRPRQQVTIGIPEDVVVRWSLFIYLLPVASLIIGAWLGFHLSGNEGITALAGFAGLVVGGALVRLFSDRARTDPRLQPVLLGSVSP